MLNNRSNSIAIMGLLAAASMPSVGGNVEVLTREDSYTGYRMGRRFRDPHVSDRGYPGSKLAKKAYKRTLTLNGIR